MNDEERAARIIRNPTFQALQNWFSKTYGVGSGIFDRKVHPLTYEVNHKDYCTCIRKTPTGIFRCRESDERLIAKCEAGMNVCWHRCKNGLLDLGIPIKMGNKPVAFLLVGQLRGRFSGSSTEKNPRIIQETIAGCKVSKANMHKTRTSLKRAFNSIPVLHTEDLERIDEAARRFGEMLSWLLTTLGDWKPPEGRLGEYLEKANNATTVDELLEISVNFFPRIIGSRDCSIFCVGEDVDLGKQLILRKTSYLPLKKKEGTEYYELGEGLTGWVWKHARSLRLKNLTDKAELASIHPDDPPAWKGKLRDSIRRREFLCVPIFGRSPGEVIGVVRTPVKPGGFTVDDEITLSALGEHLYSLIELCERRERATDVRKAIEIALSLQKCVSQRDVWKMLLSAAISFFGHEGKAYLVNLLEPGNKSFSISYVGGELATSDLLGRRYKLGGTATGFVVSKQEPILIHDIPTAQREKRYLPAVKGGHSGMLAPICHNGEECLGIVGVVADKRYAFNLEDLDLLRHLSECAGKAHEHVTIRSAASEAERLRILSNLLNGLMHDLGTPSSKAHTSIRDLLPCGTIKNQFDLLMDFILTGISAYQFTPVESPGGEFMGLDKSLIQRVHEQSNKFLLKPLIQKCVAVLDICEPKLPKIFIRCPSSYRVKSDYALLMIIVYNLLKNARANADEKNLSKLRITVCVRRVERHTILTVTDYNAPLPDATRESLFQFKPTAYGLAISNLFAYAHPGRPPTGRGLLSYRRIRGKNVFTVEIRG
jgi:ligand-binding sensor protein